MSDNSRPEIWLVFNNFDKTPDSLGLEHNLYFQFLYQTI